MTQSLSWTTAVPGARRWCTRQWMSAGPGQDRNRHSRDPRRAGAGPREMSGSGLARPQGARLGRGPLWPGVVGRGLLVTVGGQERAQRGQRLLGGFFGGMVAAAGNDQGLHVVGGEHSLKEQVADTMKLAADDVQTLVVPGCGHHPPEEAPEETLAALTAFLAPYRG